MSDSDTFLSAARAPRYPHSRYLNAAYNRPQTAPPEPAPEPAEVSGIADISAMDQATYAANRDQLLGGVKPAGEFVGLDSPTGRPALTADQMTAFGMGYGAHATTGYEPRPRGIPAAGHTSIGGHPFRGAAIENRDKS